MPIITLTSDYGYSDYRVSAIKGTIFSLSPEIKVTDISHNIQAYNILQGSYIVRNAYSFFPKRSVHLISIDSFYHSERKFLVMKADGHYFVAPDNGILALVFHDIKPEGIFEITINNRFDDKVVFTATDIFVPVSIHLAKGGIPEIIGRKINKIKEVSFPKPFYNESEKIIIGEVLYIDNFGNVITNISRESFKKHQKYFDKFEIKFRNLSMANIYSGYTEIVKKWTNEREYHGKGMAVFNAQGLLELCIYKGNLHNGASSLFGLSVGEKVFIEFR